MSKTEEKYFQSNKELWNKRTSIHKTSDFYNLEGFRKGNNALNEIELDELGDVSDKSILHALPPPLPPLCVRPFREVL